MNKPQKVIIETIQILVGILLSYFFWKNNFLLCGIYIALAGILIYLHKDKTELAIFIYGIIIGTLVETVGTKISGYQSFAQPDFSGIPVWLPFAWGYGFIAMKRIGFAIKNA